MKKQFFTKMSMAAAAVVGAMHGSVMAEVSVFGILDGGYASVKAPGGSAGTGFVSGGMTTSAFGIKGNEDLGGGLKADFAVSSFIEIGSGSVLSGIGPSSPNLFTREAWVGLGSEYGHVSLGRDVNPAFIPVIAFNAYGDSTVYSPLWNATFFNTKTGTDGLNSAAKGLFSDTAWDGQFRYTSPNIGGAVFDVNYAIGTDGKKNVGGNVMYFNGALGLTAFYMDTKSYPIGSLETNIFGSGSAKTYFVGASYDFGVAKTFATYQEGKQSSTGLKSKTWHLSSAIPAGPGKVLLAYAHSKTSDGDDTTYKQAAIGYNYPLSKKMDLYANFLSASETGLSKGHVYGGGVRYAF